MKVKSNNQFFNGVSWPANSITVNCVVKRIILEKQPFFKFIT